MNELEEWYPETPWEDLVKADAVSRIATLEAEVTHQRQLVQDYISALELERKRTSGIAIPHGYYLAKLDGEHFPKEEHGEPPAQTN